MNNETKKRFKITNAYGIYLYFKLESVDTETGIVPLVLWHNKCTDKETLMQLHRVISFVSLKTLSDP
jgi:hypothetical protein